MSMAPSLGRCSPFSPIVEDGTALSISDSDDAVEIVSFPFVFAWRDLSDYSHVTVTSNGVIFIGNTTNNGCCSPRLIESSPYQEEKRVAVAQSDLNPATGGSIYTGILGDALIVSWKGVPRISSNAAEFGLYFQVVLYRCSEVELRWGEGIVTAVEQFAAGLQESEAGIAVLATEDSFSIDPWGLIREGTWPRDECRLFVLSE